MKKQKKLTVKTHQERIAFFKELNSKLFEQFLPEEIKKMVLQNTAAITDSENIIANLILEDEA